MKKVLITGISGMIGKHLAKKLKELNYIVGGISRSTSYTRYDVSPKEYKIYYGDIMDKNFLEIVWTEFKPDIVFHLAAQSYNGESWKFEETTYLTNIYGTKNVLDVCVKITPNVRFIPACSSAEYGIVSDDLIPMNEDKTPLKPITPYGVTKATMEMMTRQYHLNYKLDVILPRLFIHVGPDHPPVTAIQNFAKQLAMIKLGIKEPIMNVGNLETSRDFIDVRDGVNALILLAEKGISGEVYNICNGIDYTIRETLEYLIEISGLEVTVESDKSLFRPTDEKVLLGDNSKLKTLGWKSEILFKTTLKDIYNNWLERLSI